jgi:glucose/arabinose dehydrogenase
LAVAALVLGAHAAWAQAAGKNGAVVTKWAEGLSGAQGIVRGENGEVWIAENTSGRVVRFDAAGKRLGVLAEGLKAPSWMLYDRGNLFISERQGNSVARVSGGKLSRLPGEVIDPLGLALDPAQPGALLVLSHRQSHVRRYVRGADGSYSLQAEPAIAPQSGAQYGWRDLMVEKDGTVLVTDEIGKAVLRRRPGSAFEPWVKDLTSPSGMGRSSRGELYLTEEGWRLSRVMADGSLHVLAEGLGAARALLFLDARTILVTDRRGDAVWKVTLPQ